MRQDPCGRDRPRPSTGLWASTGRAGPGPAGARGAAGCRDRRPLGGLPCPHPTAARHRRPRPARRAAPPGRRDRHRRRRRRGPRRGPAGVGDGPAGLVDDRGARAPARAHRAGRAWSWWRTTSTTATSGAARSTSGPSTSCTCPTPSPGWCASSRAAAAGPVTGSVLGVLGGRGGVGAEHARHRPRRGRGPRRPRGGPRRRGPARRRAGPAPRRGGGPGPALERPGRGQRPAGARARWRPRCRRRPGSSCVSWGRAAPGPGGLPPEGRPGRALLDATTRSQRGSPCVDLARPLLDDPGRSRWRCCAATRSWCVVPADVRGVAAVRPAGWSGSRELAGTPGSCCAAPAPGGLRGRAGAAGPGPAGARRAAQRRGRWPPPPTWGVRRAAAAGARSSGAARRSSRPVPRPGRQRRDHPPAAVLPPALVDRVRARLLAEPGAVTAAAGRGRGAGRGGRRQR